LPESGNLHLDEETGGERAALSARRRMSCPAARAMGSCERILASVTADYKPRVVKPYAL